VGGGRTCTHTLKIVAPPLVSKTVGLLARWQVQFITCGLCGRRSLNRNTKKSNKQLKLELEEKNINDQYTYKNSVRKRRSSRL